ncbi:MAG TPA: hypothetical protein VFO39_14620 [Candidatus Sulfotelmatobacter sp.]|nr:hypothetical protein [Candidatus Sulfotelmatobacter sp.]
MSDVKPSEFSIREWFGIAAGISWGLVLSRFFASGDMTGPWLVILLGPPAVLLISPMRPILSWQLPIVTAILASAVSNRSPEDSIGEVLAVSVLTWLICSLFSSPWALIFERRARHARGKTVSTAIPIAYIGVGLMVFAASGLILLGFALTIRGGFDETGFTGFLMAIAGVVLSLVTERFARTLEIHKPIRSVLQYILLVPALFAITAFIVSMNVTSINSLSSAASNSDSLTMAAGLEALVAFIWLEKEIRQDQKAIPKPSTPSA